MDGIGILSGIGYHGIGREQSVTLNSSLGEIFRVFSNTWGFHRVGVCIVSVQDNSKHFCSSTIA
jgi:hypothetical protein